MLDIENVHLQVNSIDLEVTQLVTIQAQVTLQKPHWWTSICWVFSCQ